MAKPKNLIDKRMANALITGAEASGFANKAMGVGGQMGMKVVQKVMGGLWVGGNAWLTPDELIFEPNKVNVAAHKTSDDLKITLALKDVGQVNWRKGIATSIIDVEAGDQTLTIRCYKAQSFAERIREAAGAAA